VLSPARALFHHCDCRDPETGYLLFLNWDWVGAALGIQISMRRDSWLLFQFPRDKVPYFYFALALACAT